MGATVRQKVKGKGKPWWVFISHDGQRTSRKVGDKKAAEVVASKIRAKGLLINCQSAFYGEYGLLITTLPIKLYGLFI